MFSYLYKNMEQVAKSMLIACDSVYVFLKDLSVCHTNFLC